VLGEGIPVLTIYFVSGQFFLKQILSGAKTTSKKQSRAKSRLNINRGLMEIFFGKIDPQLNQHWLTTD
jgi:hypothetical protein